MVKFSKTDYDTIIGKKDGTCMAELFLVATPIGNLQDITLRALHVLQSVDVIACEDTRHSLKLFNAHSIQKPLVSCHANNKITAARRIISLLKDGQDVALVSDAGTPGISDPGSFLVQKVREAGFGTVPVPGASALTAILSVSAFSCKRVVFEGFLSSKDGRRKKQLKGLLETGDSFILYESPFRVLKLLNDIEELGVQTNDRRKLLCGRELTKSHEEILEGYAGEICDILARRPSVKGEFVFQISSRIKKGSIFPLG